MFKSKVNNPKVLTSYMGGGFSEEVEKIIGKHVGIKEKIKLCNSFSSRNNYVQVIIDDLKNESHENYLAEFEKRFVEAQKLNSKGKEEEQIHKQIQNKLGGFKDKIDDLNEKPQEQEEENQNKLGEFKDRIHNLNIYEHGIKYITPGGWFGKSSEIVIHNNEMTGIELSKDGEHYQYDVVGGMIFGNNPWLGGQTGKGDNATLSFSIFYKTSGAAEESLTISLKGSNTALQEIDNKVRHHFKFLMKTPQKEESDNVIRQLKEAKELLDDEVLSQEEFNKLKRKLLN
jgi:hypothetical protein